MPRMPDRFCVDKDDRPLYDKLVKEGPLKRKNRRDQFMFAMAVGFKNKFALDLEKRETSGFFNVDDLREEDTALINSMILFKNKSAEVLLNWKKVVEIAEKYAHGGVKLLVEKLKATQFGTYWKRFEKEVRDMYSDLSSSPASRKK